MLFNGSGANENFDVSADGERVRFARNVGNIVMDVNDVERIDINALGGTDNIVINDLSSTDVAAVNIDLGAAGAGDGQVDTVQVNGTDGGDSTDVFGNGTSASVIGLSAQVEITNLESANDHLVVDGGAGNDTIDASAVAAGIVQLTIDGGAGDDTIFGSQGADLLLGGDGSDFVDGGRGNDVAQLGAGDDTFVWNPGDGSDVVEGQDGTDTMLFNGANVSESIDISANGERVRFSRDVANITMDLNDVERIHFNALGGADHIVINDLSGSDVKEVAIDLGVTGAGDGQPDVVTANGTNGDDAIVVTGDADGITVDGLPAQVTIAHAEAGDQGDRLVINGLGGDDTIDASGLAAGAIGLQLVGGDGADTIIGSAGDDDVLGGRGNDVALLGAGDDAFTWNPGDGSDTVEGQSGFDTMLFNGAGVAENIDISANGERVLFTRNVANITMDLNGVERIEFNALGGTDTVAINDLSGTDATEVAVNLAGTLDGPAGDGQVDTVIANGTNGDDVVNVFAAGTAVDLFGLAAQVHVDNFESGATKDQLVVNGGAGDDVLVNNGSIGVTLDGGDGDDILLAGDGGDTLIGGAGDDTLIGGAGDDTLIGGDGDDVLIGGAGNDVFDPGTSGDITIQGFVAGADRIDLHGVAGATDFAWVQAHTQDVDGNAVLDLGNGANVTLTDVSTTALSANDFLL